MKKIIGTGLSVSALSLALIGCGNLGTTTANTVDYVATTGTRAVVLVGQPATQQDIVVFRRAGVVHHDGRAYHIRNGKYVLVR